jgi:hypothetical protein
VPTLAKILLPFHNIDNRLYAPLGRAGYGPEVVPVIGTLITVLTLDELDRMPARFWIDNLKYHESLYDRDTRSSTGPATAEPSTPAWSTADSPGAQSLGAPPSAAMLAANEAMQAAREAGEFFWFDGMVCRTLWPPPSEAALAARAAVRIPGTLSTDRVLRRLPTPLDWIDELRRRGVGVSGAPTAEDMKNFARWREFFEAEEAER